MTIDAQVDTKTSVEMGTAGAGAPTFWTLFESKFNTFVATVNGHGVNSGRQITVRVAPSAATSDLYRGIVFAIGHPTYGAMNFRLQLNNTVTGIVYSAGTVWTAGAANGGLGTITSTIDLGSQSGTFVASAASDVVTYYDDTAGQEIFFCNWRTNSSASQMYFVVFKDTQGDWVAHFGTDANGEPGNATYAVMNTGWTVADYCYTRGLSASYFAISPGLEFASGNIGTIVGDPLVSKTWIRAASQKVGICATTEPFVPFFFKLGQDWVSMGCGFVFNLTGLI